MFGSIISTQCPRNSTARSLTAKMQGLGLGSWVSQRFVLMSSISVIRESARAEVNVRFLGFEIRRSRFRPLPLSYTSSRDYGSSVARALMESLTIVCKVFYLDTAVLLFYLTYYFSAFFTKEKYQCSPKHMKYHYLILWLTYLTSERRNIVGYGGFFPTSKKRILGLESCHGDTPLNLGVKQVNT